MKTIRNVQELFYEKKEQFRWASITPSLTQTDILKIQTTFGTPDFIQLNTRRRTSENKSFINRNEHGWLLYFKGIPVIIFENSYYNFWMGLVQHYFDNNNYLIQEIKSWLYKELNNS